MERIEYLTKSMSRKQKELYVKICELKQFRAVGQNKKTCKVLLQFGLIEQPKGSENKNDYVLVGEPMQIPMNEKLPLKKEIVQEIKEVQRPWGVINETIEERERPKIKHPQPDHTNPSQDDHINRWLSVDVTPGKKEMVKVKGLQDWQMKYIMLNHEQSTSKDMAEHLQVEKFMVKLFCLQNNIEPMPPPKKRKPKDEYHCIPYERQLRMKKVGYNGPQKKTA
jgi:hypothetical protein